MSALRSVRRRDVLSYDGESLAVFESGPRHAPPLLLVHGISQSHRAFLRQLEGSLAEKWRVIALDLRGHGASAKPIGGYDRGETWADDIAAVLGALSLDNVVIAGWSYGVAATLDYVAHHGDTALRGLLLHGGPLALSPETAPAIIGEAFQNAVTGMTSDHADEVVAGLGAFIRSSFGGPVPDALFYETLGYNVAVPIHVRRGIFSRSFDHRGTLSGVSCPTIFAVGADDRIVRPMALRQADDLPNVRAMVLENAGHAWFWHDPDRFARLLDQLVRATPSTDGETRSASGRSAP